MFLARSRRRHNRHNNPAPVLGIRVHFTPATAVNFVGRPTNLVKQKSPQQNRDRHPGIRYLALATKCPGSFPQHFRDRNFDYLASALAGLESWGLSFGLEGDGTTGEIGWVVGLLGIPWDGGMIRLFEYSDNRLESDLSVW